MARNPIDSPMATETNPALVALSERLIDLQSRRLIAIREGLKVALQNPAFSDNDRTRLRQAEATLSNYCEGLVRPYNEIQAGRLLDVHEALLAVSESSELKDLVQDFESYCQSLDRGLGRH